MRARTVLVIYTYYLLDEAGSVREFEFEGCRDDRAARALAPEVLERHPGRAAVEVRRGEHLIECVGRDAIDRRAREPGTRRPPAGDLSVGL